MSQNRSSRFIPLIVAISVVAGILIGSFYANHFAGNKLSIINTSSNKLNDLLHIISDQYVDKVNTRDLVEKALPKILNELDPHSAYIGAKDVEKSMEDLKGSFSGIGISYLIIEDTVRVINVVEGGPSEDSGLQPGDCIISVDNKPFVGKEVTADKAASTLKGPKNSKVIIGIKRKGHKKPLSYTIVRGDIPVKSIAATYMLNENTGYIKINNFSSTTYPELLASLAKLNRDKFQGLVIDLRNNGGGYMQPAVQTAYEFLPTDRLVLYTEGYKSPREEFRSNGRGSYQSLPLVILVDETTASASEILAGAIQDNDRGTIIGRRTFGKGLVQEPIQFADGSMLRLTISRYYTPSGRCLQKPYVKGEREEYEMDIIKRAENGEYYTQDSIHTDGKAYKTRLGRTVYGGGGIIPDIFIPHDTLGMTSYFKEAYIRGLIFKYAYIYVDEHRTQLNQYTDYKSLVEHLKKERIPEKFSVYAEKNGLKRRNLMLRTSHKLFEEFLFDNIINNLMDKNVAIQYANENDPCVLKAIEVLEKGEAFPKATSTPKAETKNVETKNKGTNKKA